ncbi:MAG: hypothetical protein QF805_28990 [Pirellulaceae bacterium]|jgi:hypothetical protein|nr:hypothetical protein [Pirellulaceae bacterium]
MRFLLTSDLMLSSKAPPESQVVPDVASLLAQCSPRTELVAIDLTSGADVDDLVTRIREISPRTRVIAFGPHVRNVLLERAAEAGCQVMTNGQFHQELIQLFSPD